jgi:hypothetical protein
MIEVEPDSIEASAMSGRFQTTTLIELFCEQSATNTIIGTLNLFSAQWIKPLAFALWKGFDETGCDLTLTPPGLLSIIAQ